MRTPPSSCRATASRSSEESYVVVYDNQSMLDSGGLFYFLAPGDQYDMAERQAYRPARTLAPLGRVERRPWPNR